jgi:hypothetical protein
MNTMSYDPEEYYPEDEHIIECPECNSPLEEVWQTFFDKYENEAEGMVGYKCKKCDVSYNRYGDII